MSQSKMDLPYFATSFLGLQHHDPVFGRSEPRRRIYLDTGATALMSAPVWRGMEHYLKTACANSHTLAHRAGRETTQAIEDSRDAIGRLVGYKPSQDVVLFTANGATGATNFLARALFPPEMRTVLKRFAPDQKDLISQTKRVLGAARASRLDNMLERPLVLTSVMEHHSNLLPWMEAVGHANVRSVGIRDDGCLDVDALREILKTEGHRVRLVAITAVSNVTGIANPVHSIASLAHQVGAEILVDAAQWVPHSPVAMHTDTREASIDYLVLSGHKMYAPGSRGALVGKLASLEGCHCVSDVGGGMVDYVSMDEFDIKDQVTAREEAGTPNIPGSIAMGLIAEILLHVGMQAIHEREAVLTKTCMERLKKVPTIRIYGSTNLNAVPRAGVFSFNLPGIPHGVVASYLSDFHNIAVRDGCFCAQPYVKALLHCDEQTIARVRSDMHVGDHRNIPGAVRASLGVYSTEDDIHALGDALDTLVSNRNEVLNEYQVAQDGTYRAHGIHPTPGFSIAAFVNNLQQ